MHSLKNKLRSQAGETIAEVLVAMLISALALTMLASMITATVSMVTRSKEKMKEYYENGESLELMSADPETINVTMSGTGLLVSAKALCYKNETFQGDRVVYSYVIKEDTADSPAGP